MGAVVAGGGVAALIEVLQEGPEDAKDNAAAALGEIAQHEEHVGAVVAGGGVAALIKVLQEDPKDAKDNVAFALANTAKHEEGVGAVVAGGGVAALTVLVVGPILQLLSFAQIAVKSAEQTMLVHCNFGFSKGKNASLSRSLEQLRTSSLF